MRLAVQVHHKTAIFPKCEYFGLMSQIRRSAVSIPSNVAEGSARSTTRELIHFLRIARGSLAELETQLLLAREFGYLQESDYAGFASLTDEVGRLLTAFLNSLCRKNSATR